MEASPNGISKCSCHAKEKKLLEVKYPFSQRETLNIDEAVTDTDFFIDANKNLRKDHKYYAQVQCQLFLCNFEKCDFVVWTRVWLHIREIERDVQFMTNVLGTLQNFYIQNILPEVLTRKIENSAPKILDGQKDKLYCFCNSLYSSDEIWIDCDSEKCKWE